MTLVSTDMYVTENIIRIQMRALDIVHLYLVTLDLLGINCKIHVKK